MLGSLFPNDLIIWLPPDATDEIVEPINFPMPTMISFLTAKARPFGTVFGSVLLDLGKRIIVKHPEVVLRVSNIPYRWTLIALYFVALLDQSSSR